MKNILFLIDVISKLNFLDSIPKSISTEFCYYKFSNRQLEI